MEKMYHESEKIIDMHMHSCYSDGELTPKELICLAIDKRIGTMAITDHNTINGIKSIDRNDPLIVDSGINIINGVELSAEVDKGTMHILGYDFDLNNENLNQKLTQFKDNNMNYFLSLIVELKKKYGISFSHEEIKNLINDNRNLGRPDIARLCLKHGYVSSVNEAFNKYLIPIYEKVRGENKLFTYEECFDMILNSGGIPVLAHPKTLKLNEKELLEKIKCLISYGLKGIEVYHSIHTEEERRLYLEIANKYNLLVSGGSDYHGPIVKPDIELGKGKNNNLKIKKLSLLDSIR